MLIVQFYHKMALAKNLHEQKTNLVNIYRVQKGCGTKIKGLHTFSVVFIHKMALKNSVRLEVNDCVLSEFIDFMFFRGRLNGV